MRHRISVELLWPSDGTESLHGSIPSGLDPAIRGKVWRRRHALEVLHASLFPED